MLMPAGVIAKDFDLASCLFCRWSLQTLILQRLLHSANHATAAISF